MIQYFCLSITDVAKTYKPAIALLIGSKMPGPLLKGGEALGYCPCPWCCCLEQDLPPGSKQAPKRCQTGLARL